MKNKEKCVFLDRDSVINYCDDNQWVNKPEEFLTIPETAESIKAFKEAGYLVIVITNQGSIENGFQTEEGLAELHEFMNDQILNLTGYELDAVYHCPHYAEPCECRKPKPGMILQAIEDFNIDPAQSFMIGDRSSDAIAGTTAGCCGITIQKNKGVDSSLRKLILTGEFGGWEAHAT